MQKQKFLAAGAIAAVIFLAACNGEPEKIEDYDPMAEQLKKAPKVTELPPAIANSETYRCSDNSLVYVDFYTNDTARLRTPDRQAEPVVLSAEGGNPPFTAEGYSVSGSGENVQITTPGKNNLTCRS